MKAMIFAAGLGTRFKPWTEKHPKALAPVNGKSLLQRNIEYLQQYDIYDVVVNVHHFADQVIDIINANNGWGSNIIISDESDELLDTGGGLLKARTHLQDDLFITMNADILTNLNIGEFINSHRSNEAMITLAVTDRKTSRYLLFDPNNRLCGWKNSDTGEKKIAVPMQPLKPLAYSGIAIFQPEVFHLITQTGKFSLTETYLKLADGSMIMAYDHTGDIVIDVGKPGTVRSAERLFA